MPSHPHSRTIALVLACGILAAAGPVRGAETDPLKLAERLNKKALDDYDALEFESARTTLQSAIGKLRDSGQDDTPTAARIYVNLGMVILAGFKDRNRAIQQFVEALKIDATVQIDPEHVTPELQDAFDEAKRKVPRAAPPPRTKPPANEPAGDDAEPPPAKGNPAIHGIQHNSVDEAREGQEVIIRAQLGADVTATRVFLFYRSGGKEDYTAVPMEVSKGGDWFGTIPPEAVVPKTVQYYIEARDARGRPAIAAGSASSPYIIIVAESERRPDVVEHPLTNPQSAGARAKAEAPVAGRGYGRLFFNLMVGTGFGIEGAGNRYEVAYVYRAAKAPDIGSFQPLTVNSTGGAWSGLHGLLEVGVNITNRISLSGVMRIQGTLINNADASGDVAAMPLGDATIKETLAAAGLVRLRYHILTGRFRPSVRFGIGGGTIRHVLDISGAESEARPLVDAGTAEYYAGMNKDPYDSAMVPQPPKVNQVCLGHRESCYDNIEVGFFMTSIGGSLFYELTTWRNGGFGLIADLAAIFAFAGPNPFGMNLDLSLGVGGHFL